MTLEVKGLPLEVLRKRKSSKWRDYGEGVLPLPVAEMDFEISHKVRDVLIGKMAKRNVDVRYLKDDKTETIGGDKRKQTMQIQKGITSDLSKKVVRIIKDSKLKVQASIQGDAVRVTGAKRDDLQATMALLKKDVTEAPLGFNNFRD